MAAKLLLLCALVGAVVCQGRREGHIRVFHASPDAPAVDILVNGKVAFANVAYPSVTHFATLPDGIYEVAFTSSLLFGFSAGCWCVVGDLQ